MTDKIYTATKTRSNRRGWSVTFRHPRRRDARGKVGLKVRRGLGTSDDVKADEMVEQLNQLLSDQSWWTLDRRTEADQLFGTIVVKAFFDGMETGKANSRQFRNDMLEMPTREDGYARVMFVGSTGAGKTTLLRQLIGSDHRRDRFPSTSTAKTTTAEIEIITAPTGPFEAAVTFMNEHEVRGAVDECLEAACVRAIRGGDDQSIVGAILEHPEQRFRLSYPLGSWRQELPNKERDSMFDDEEGETDALPAEEVVPDAELKMNNSRLTEYVQRVKEVAAEVHDEVSQRLGSFQQLDKAPRREEWLEHFTDALYENQRFTQISLDIVDVIRDRFELIVEGDFEGDGTDWPTLWYYEESDRAAFLRQVRWFTGNHSQQFGRLLTPLVDGIRVSGPFQPATAELLDDDRRLVLLDGEGLGHSAKEATSISTKVTERFQDVDMILLIDSAQSPMQAAAIELLRSVGTSGHGHKMGVVFTHFDQVRGDNLSSYQQKVDHVYASVSNALGSLRDSIGTPVVDILERQLAIHKYFLGGLDRHTQDIPKAIIESIRQLLVVMQKSADPLEPVDGAPIYEVRGLELGLRDATDGFKNAWNGRLGRAHHMSIPKEHWTRIKALNRRIANRWDIQYNDLMPVADFVKLLQAAISLWLDKPSQWTVKPADEKEEGAAISSIKQYVFAGVHDLCEQRLIDAQHYPWREAYDFRGTGSTYKRADVMSRIYDAAAPTVSSVMSEESQRFLDEVVEVVRNAIEEAGGSVHGVGRE